MIAGGGNGDHIAPDAHITLSVGVQSRGQNLAVCGHAQGEAGACGDGMDITGPVCQSLGKGIAQISVGAGVDKAAHAVLPGNNNMAPSLHIDSGFSLVAHGGHGAILL